MITTSKKRYRIKWISRPAQPRVRMYHQDIPEAKQKALEEKRAQTEEKLKKLPKGMSFGQMDYLISRRAF